MASFILMIIIVGMVGVWHFYYSAQSKSRNMLIATSLCRSVLELNMAGGYNSLDALVDQPAVITPFVSHSQFRGHQIEVTYEVSFKVSSIPAQPGFRRLVVRLDWREDTGDKTVSYETYLYRTQ